MRSIDTPDAPASTSPVAQATLARGLLFVGGQMPRDPGTGRIPEDPAAQVDLTLRHCLAIVAAAGGGPAQVAKVTVYVTDLSVKPLVNEAFVRVFGAHRPTRDLVEVSAIGETAVVEASMIAVLGQAAPSDA